MIPWLRRGWVDAWWDAFGGDGELVGVDGTPLVARRGALRSPTNWHTPAYGLAGPAASIFARRPRSVSIAFVDPQLGLDELIAAARAAGYRTHTRLYERSPFISLNGSYDELLASLDRRMIKDLRRLRRRLEDQGEVTFELHDGRERLEELLAEGLPVEASGWKAEQGTAIVSDPAIERFYRAVARWAADEGILRLGFLRLDGSPIAFELNMEDDGVWYALKGGYDADFRKYGPGQLILLEILRHAYDRGLASYEFLGSDDAYKLQWTGRVRERWLFQAFAPVAGLPEYVLYRYGRPLARKVLRR